jgi:hypothetical protein
MSKQRNAQAETLNLRLESELKIAFTEAADAEHRSAADVLREFMREYVERVKRRHFEVDARRESALIAEAAADPNSDEAQVMREIDSIFEMPDQK